MTERFIPPHPPRRSRPVQTWRGFFGERARTAVYGWSERAFTYDYFKRNVLGHTVHVVLKPEWVERVLLDNAANYEKPKLVKRILAPTIGRGLLSSDGKLWRAQRKIVAASFTPPAVDALVPVFARVGRTMAEAWQAGTRDMAVEATTATMTVISEALFSGDARLTSRAAMDHITHAKVSAKRGCRCCSACRWCRSVRAAFAAIAACAFSGARWARSCASGWHPTRRKISSGT